MLGSLLAIGRSILEIVGIRARRKERQEAKEAGAAEQRLADQEEALDAREDQTRKAVNRRPGDASDRLDNGSF